MICLCGHPYLSHESGECTEKGCPCAKWEEVAEGPYLGIDVSESPDASVMVLVNTETGEFAATNGAHGFFDFSAYVSQGGGLIGDPLKDITARQTATIADLSKMSWDDPRNPFKNTDEQGRLRVGDGSDGRLPWKVR